jgi:hypothetical protein
MRLAIPATTAHCSLWLRLGQLLVALRLQCSMTLLVDPASLQKGQASDRLTVPTLKLSVPTRATAVKGHRGHQLGLQSPTSSRLFLSPLQGSAPELLGRRLSRGVLKAMLLPKAHQVVMKMVTGLQDLTAARIPRSGCRSMQMTSIHNCHRRRLGSRLHLATAPLRGVLLLEGPRLGPLPRLAGHVPRLQMVDRAPQHVRILVVDPERQGASKRPLIL